VELLHGGDLWICSSRAIFSELELSQTHPKSIRIAELVNSYCCQGKKQLCKEVKAHMSVEFYRLINKK
jgi:hypothetical protein